MGKRLGFRPIPAACSSSGGYPRSVGAAGSARWASDARPRAPTSASRGSGALPRCGVHSGLAKHADGLAYWLAVVVAGKTMGFTKGKEGWVPLRERGKGV